jgi:hypothetical protein
MRSTPIHPMTGWPLLFPASSTRIPIGVPYGALSQQERYGLTTFRTYTTDDVGSACSPVARHLREMMREHLLLATHLLVQASQPLWLVASDDVYQRFTYVSHIIPPSLPTALRLAVVDVPSQDAHHHIGEATLSQELHTARLPRPHVLVGYWWQNTRLCPYFRSHNSYTCDFVSQPSQKPACGFPAQASSPSLSPNRIH